MDDNAFSHNLDPPIGDLSAAVARANGMLLSRDDADRAVDLLAQVARDMVPSAVGAGASLIEDDGRRTSAGTTDRLATAADALQYQLGEGPCISAWATVSVQRIDDTETDSRWGAWCPEAQRMGIRSVLSAPMVFRGDAIGALKVYGWAPEAFTVEDERRLVLLAGAAATLLGASHGTDGPHRVSAALRSALSSRRAVETAIGMLMERHGLTHDQARERLLQESRTTQVRLAELAHQVVSRSGPPER